MRFGGHNCLHFHLHSFSVLYRILLIKSQSAQFQAYEKEDMITTTRWVRFPTSMLIITNTHTHTHSKIFYPVMPYYNCLNQVGNYNADTGLVLILRSVSVECGNTTSLYMYHRRNIFLQIFQKKFKKWFYLTDCSQFVS